MSVEELRTVFQNADTDNSGSLDKAELRKHLQEHLGHKINGQKLNKLFEFIDTNHNNLIELEEFLAYAGSNPEYLAADHHEHGHGHEHAQENEQKSE